MPVPVDQLGVLGGWEVLPCSPDPLIGGVPQVALEAVDQSGDSRREPVVEVACGAPRSSALGGGVLERRRAVNQ